MADQIESLGLNLEITNAETFKSDIKDSNEALDAFDTVAQKIITTAVGLNNAFTTIQQTIGTVKSGLNTEVTEIKTFGESLTATLNAVRAAQNKATSKIVTPVREAAVGKVDFGPTGILSGTFGGETQKAAEEVKAATNTIEEAFAGMEREVQTQLDKVNAATRQTGENTQTMSAQIGAAFKRDLEVFAAQQGRTLERNQLASRAVVGASTLQDAERVDALASAGTRASEEFQKFTVIVETAKTQIYDYMVQLNELTIGTVEYKDMIKQIGGVEKSAANDLRILTTESGVATDRFKAQVRELSALNKEFVGAKSMLSPTREGLVDTGSEDLIRTIQGRVAKAQSAIKEALEKGVGDTSAILTKQNEVEEQAANFSEKILVVLDETTNKSVDYRKAKLRELLDETRAVTNGLIEETNREVSAQKAKLEFDQVYTATEAKLQQQQLQRTRGLQDAKLNYSPNQKFGATIDTAAAREMADLAAIRDRALQVGPADHGLLEELRAIATQAKETTAAIKDQVAAESQEDMSLRAANRMRTRNQTAGLNAGQVITGRIQIATESDNAVIRTTARAIQDIQDALSSVTIAGQAFMAVIRGIISVVEALLIPFKALINIAELVANGFSALTRFASFGFLGGKKPVDDEAASLAGLDRELKTIGTSAEKSSSSLLSFFNIFKNNKPSTGLPQVAPITEQLPKLEAPNLSAFNAETEKAKSGIGGIIASIKEAVGSFFNLGQSAKTAGTEIESGAAHATEMATGLQSIGTAAQESTSKLSSFFAQIKGGFVEGIGKGIAEVLTMNIMMGIQNAVFGIGDMIKGAFSSAMTEMDQVLQLTGILQKNIMETKGYTNLNQSLDEASVKAKQLYDWVQRLAIVSPFNKNQLMNLFQMANDFGYTAQNAQVLTQTLADFAAVAHTSVGGAQSIMNALGQIRESGVITTRIVKQLGQAGFDVMPALEQTFHQSAAGIHEALKHSQLDAKTAVEGIVKYFQKDYGGQAAKAGGTVSGLMSSIVDLKDKLLAISLEPILEKIVKPILLFITTVGQTKEVEAIFTGVGESIKNFAHNVEGFLAGAFWVVKAALDAIPQPIKTFWNEWQKMSGILFIGSLVLLAIPPILGLIGAAIGVLLSPLSLAAAAIAAFSLSYKNNLFGVREVTDSVLAEISVLWQEGLSGGFAAILDYMAGWYESFVSILQTVTTTIQGAFSAETFTTILSEVDAFISSFEQGFIDLGPQIQSAIDYVYAAIGPLPEFLSTIVQDVFDIIGAVPQGFADVMDSVVQYGTAIIQFFALGIIQAAHYIIDALNFIGKIITNWLQPHSPPKLLPDLETWGKQAANIYFAGWTKADMSMFTDLSGMLEKAVGAIRPNGLSAAGTKRIREMMANTLQGVKLTGNLDESGLRDVGGRFNDEIIGLTKAYLAAASSANVLKKAQDELATTTKAYDDQLAPLNDRLKAIKDLQSSFDIAGQMKDLQNVLSNSFATKDQQDQAKAKMEELGIQKQINDLDAEKNTRTAGIQDRINKATAENKVAQDTVDLLKERFQQEIDMLGLENKKDKTDKDRKEREKKPKKPKKPKEMDVVDPSQPDFGSMDLPELDTSGLTSLSDIMDDAKKRMESAFKGVKDALKPALDGLKNLKDAANGVVDAFAKGFSGGEGSALSGVQKFAFNVGASLLLANLAISTFITSVANFSTNFMAAFNLEQGSIGQKIVGALDATGTTAAVTKFVADLIAAVALPVAFGVQFAMAFFMTPGSITQRIDAGLTADKANAEAAIGTFRTALLAKIDEGTKFAEAFVAAFAVTKGSILEKIKAGLDASGVTDAINAFKTNIMTAVKNAFGGGEQGEHGKGGGGFSIDLSSMKQSIIGGITGFDFMGRLGPLRDNLKKAIDALFGAGTGDKVGNLVAEVKTQLDLLFGTVTFADLKKSFDNLITAVKDAIKNVAWGEWTKTFDGLVTSVKNTLGGIKWDKPLEKVFDGFSKVVFGLLQAALGGGEKDKKKTDNGLGIAGGGAKEALGGAAELAATITSTIGKLLDPGVILAATGIVIGKAITAAFASTEAIMTALATSRSSDKSEATLAQQIGKTVGQAVVGLLAGILAALASIDYKTVITTTFTVVGDLNKIVGDTILGFIQGVLDEVLKLIGLAIPKWKTSTDAITVSIDTAITAASKAIDTVINKIGDLFKSAVKKFQDAMNALLGGGETKTEDGKATKGTSGTSFSDGKFFSGFDDAAKNTKKTDFIGPLLAFDAKQLEEKTKAIGVSITSGISLGALQQAKAAEAQAYIDSFLTGTKEKAGIRSPSSVFDTQVGQPIGEGVIQGANRAIKSGDFMFAALKTSFATTYAAIKTATDTFSAGLQGKTLENKNVTVKNANDLGIGTKKIFADLFTVVIKGTTDFVKQATKLWTDFKDDVIALSREMRDSVISDFDAIKTAGIADFKKLKEDVVALVKEMDQAIIDELKTLKDKISSTLQGVLDGLSAPGGILDKFHKLGADVGDKFMDGIIAELKSSTKLDAIKSAAQKAGEAAKVSANSGASGPSGPSGSTPPPKSTTPGGVKATSVVASAVNDILASVAGAGSVQASSFGTGRTTVVAPVTSQRTYVLNMNVTPSQVEAVASNYAVMETLAA